MREIALSAKFLMWKPETAMPETRDGFRCRPTGCQTFADLFTDRQLVALTTFSDLVSEARERIRHDAVAAGLPDDGVPLREGGTGRLRMPRRWGCIWRLLLQPIGR